eukprot:scaffold370_cov176-Amphora_coffeaeformis.AAC.24
MMMMKEKRRVMQNCARPLFSFSVVERHNENHPPETIEQQEKGKVLMSWSSGDGHCLLTAAARKRSIIIPKLFDQSKG